MVAVVAMYRKNWILATIGIIIVPLFTIPTRKAGETRWCLTKESQAVNDQVNGILNETMSVSGQLLVKLYGKEDYEYSRYRDANQKMINLNIKESMAGRWFRVVMSTVTSIGPMLIYLVGGILIMKYDSDLTVGDVTVLVSLLNRMYMPVNSLLNVQVDWIRSMAMFTRIFEYLHMPLDAALCTDQIDHAGFDGCCRYGDIAPLVRIFDFVALGQRLMAVVDINNLPAPSVGLRPSEPGMPYRQVIRSGPLLILNNCGRLFRIVSCKTIFIDQRHAVLHVSG